MRIGLLACALLAPALLGANQAAAQPAGELWEISSQMNMPGMPAGMGAQTQRVCQGDDPERAAAKDKDRQECKVKDKKQTATRTTVTMVCKDGTMTIDQQYNAAHTEFKGVMKMTGKEGDFTLNTSGRKVGTCDVQEARREREEKIAGVQRQVDAGKAQSAAMMKKMSDEQIQRCTKALDTMQYPGFGTYGVCYRKTDKSCARDLESGRSQQPEAASACTARVAEYCKRYQTQEGFLKARADETGAQICGVTTASIKAAQCPRAAKDGSLAFLGAFCPVEAKPIAQEHCAGRDYTSKMGGKYASFCEHYLANAEFEDRGGSGGAAQAQRPARSKPAAPGSTPAASGAQPAPAPGQPAVDPVTEGINQGIGKLKGLFGR